MCFSLPPLYATTLAKQLSQTLNDLEHMGNIYQGLAKFIVTKHGGVEFLLPNPTCMSLFIHKPCTPHSQKKFQICFESTDATFPLNSSLLQSVWYQSPFSNTLFLYPLMDTFNLTHPYFSFPSHAQPPLLNTTLHMIDTCSLAH